MKKKILIVLLIIIVIALIGVGYFVFSDMQQEDKLKTELSELDQLVNAENIDMDAINDRLDRTVTKGDYAVVEDAFKSYLRDNFDNSIQIANILNDEKITTLLKEEFIGDMDSMPKDTTVQDSIDEVIGVLNTSEEVLNLLSQNQDSWEIDGENIVFSNESLSNQYESLINSL